MKAKGFGARPALCAVATLWALALALPLLAGEAAQPPGGPAKAKREEERKLIAILQSDGRLFEKDVACRRLAVIGTKDAVPALAALLADEKLCDVARCALEAIPDPAVDEALRAALGNLKGRPLVAVIQSIGRRRDAKAIDDLAKLLGGADVDAASAAARALGRIGGPEAAKALQQTLARAPAAVRPAVGDGLVALADALLLAGKRDEAAPIYDALRKADLPRQIRGAATRGAVLARGAAGVPLLLAQLKGNEKEMVRIALRLARELPGTGVTKALAAEPSKLPPARRILLIQALGDRRDAAALPAILEAAKGGDVLVRVAALRVLPQIGDASVVPVLLDAATDREAQVARAAQAGLAGFPSTKEVDAALLAMTAKGDAGTRRAAIELAGQRRIASATPALLKAADDADGQIRAAALRALGRVVGVADLAALTRRLVKPKGPQDVGPTEAALEAACRRIPDKPACAQKLLAALPQAEGASKCAFLRLLRVVDGADALKAVRAATKDANKGIQDAAIRSLSDWPTVDAAPDLAEIARTSANATHKVLALRGYVRLIGVGDLSTGKKLAMCKEAVRLAKRPDEKKLVLAGLAEVPHPETLKMVEASLADEAVKAEAEVALLKIARAMAGSSRDEAKAALGRLIASSGNARLKRQAQDALDRIERFADYITAWQVAGPYSQEGKSSRQLFEIAFAPEKPDARDVPWRVLPAGTRPARPMMLDLGRAFGGESRVAYVRTWVYFAKQQLALLEFGTDDGNKVWLNGKVVHANPAGGAAVPGEHKVNVRLKQGWNALLMKVTQDTGPWEFCLRIRKPDGSRLEGLKIQALPPGE